MEDTCTVIGHVDFVTSMIFAKPDYMEAVKSSGLTLMFYGIDLLALASDSKDWPSPKPSAYIALDLVSIDSGKPLSSDSHSHGYPYINLLLKSLKQWTFGTEGSHVLYIPSCDIELNIGVYSLRNSLELDIPGNPRLVANWTARSKSNCYRTAVCFGKYDSTLRFDCLGSGDGVHYTSRERRTNKQFKTMRSFGWVKPKQCFCLLETTLSTVEPPIGNPNRTLTRVKSAYVQNVFKGAPVRKQAGTSTPNTSNTTPTLSTSLEKKIQTAGFDIQEAILESFDTVSYSNFARDNPRSELVRTAVRRHACTWRAVVRDDYSYGRLIKSLGSGETSGKSAFVAGCGVRSLYYADGTVSSQEHHVILSWTPNLKLPPINRSKFEFCRTTLFNPLVQVYLNLEPERDTIEVDDLNNYLENIDGVLSIPILYLNDEDYLLKSVAVEHNRWGHGKHCYSFTVKGMTFELREVHWSKARPWHKRSSCTKAR